MEMGGGYYFNALMKQILPYLETENATEFIINREKEIVLNINNEWKFIKDDKFDTTFILRFLTQIATSKYLFFDKKVPHLSTSIPRTRYRVQGIHPIITANNEPALVIRIPSKRFFSLEEFKIKETENLQKENMVINKKYCNRNAIRSTSYEELKSLVINKKNILISGGTGTGKTSFLNSLLQELPKEERIITIEDSQELCIKNINQVSLLVQKNDDTTYTYKDALNDAMRMRPDRLFLGEIDTRNAMLFLRLGNTGHSGMVSTLHSNGVEEAIHAVTLNAKFYGTDVDVDTLKQYFALSMDYIVQIKREKNTRIIDAILDVKDYFGIQKD